MNNRYEYRIPVFANNQFKAFIKFGIKDNTLIMYEPETHEEQWVFDEIKKINNSNVDLGDKEQGTGIKDIYDNFIFEGDILQDEHGNEAVIVWFDDDARFIAVDICEYELNNKTEPAYIFNDNWSTSKIISHIHKRRNHEQNY